MIKDILEVGYFYNVVCKVIEGDDWETFNIAGLIKKREQLKGEWGCRFAMFLRQVGRTK